jgi:prepilin-type N-terminal cleavage/methylation domain-containing protein
MKSARTRRFNRRRPGFTLVEVLAAMTFLGLLLPVILSALLLANRTSVLADRSGLAAQLAENRLGELLLADAWAAAESRGDFGADWPGYRWELTKTTWITDPTMTELTLRVSFEVQGATRQIQLTTLAATATTPAL